MWRQNCEFSVWFIINKRIIIPQRYFFSDGRFKTNWIDLFLATGFLKLCLLVHHHYGPSPLVEAVKEQTLGLWIHSPVLQRPAVAPSSDTLLLPGCLSGALPRCYYCSWSLHCVDNHLGTPGKGSLYSVRRTLPRASGIGLRSSLGIQTCCLQNHRSHRVVCYMDKYLKESRVVQARNKDGEKEIGQQLQTD